MTATTPVRRGGTRTLPVRNTVLVLAGGLTLLAAVAGYAVEVYEESATSCGGLVQPGPGGDPACSEYYADRERLVVALGVLGAALLALAPFGARRSTRPDSSPDFTWGECVGAATFLSLLLPFSFLPFFFTALAVTDVPLAISSSGLHDGWKVVALASGAVTACLGMRRFGLTERSSFAAAGVAVPLVLSSLVLLAHPLAAASLDSSAKVPATPLWLLASPLLLVVVLLVAVLQRRGWRGPAPLVGALTALAATAVVTVVVMPQLLPAYRDAQGGSSLPADGLAIGVWAPVLVVLSVACVALVAATSRRPAA